MITENGRGQKPSLKRKGKVEKISKVDSWTLEIFYDGGSFKVGGLGVYETMSLLHEFDTNGLFFRLSDLMLGDKYYVSFIKSEYGEDGGAWISGTRYNRRPRESKY